MNVQSDRRGILTVAASYLAWGVLPVFWNLLHEVNSLYILCSRIIWSLVFCTIYLCVRREWKKVKAVFRSKKQLLLCLSAGVIICINWGSYIWAVNNGRILDSSFGYYLNPIISVIFGAFIFKERLSKAQWFACGLSFAGVLWSMLMARTVPVLALVIGGSFACYGVIKKFLTLDSEISLFMETLMTAPIALVVGIWLELGGKGFVGVLEGPQMLLLPLTGVITAVPLLLFAYGVKRIPYYLTGMLMYLNPTMQFIMGILLYHEKISLQSWITFGFIWIGVLLMIFNSRPAPERKLSGKLG